MRYIFLILLSVAIALGIFNSVVIPNRQTRAKEIMDRHVQSFALGNIDERTYKGVIKQYPLETSIQNLKIIAGNGNIDGVLYTDIKLEVNRISFNPGRLLNHGDKKIESIDGITLEAVMSFEELARKFQKSNGNLMDTVIWFEDENLYIEGYYLPTKNKIRLDGEMLINPKGDMKYRITRVINADGDESRSQRTIGIIEDNTTLVIPLFVFDIPLKLDNIEISNDGIKVFGRS